MNSLRVISFFALLVLTSAETYYVTPSSNTPCPEEGVPCFTLSQYAHKSSNYFASNTTLILLPGNHSLDSVLTIQNISFLSIVPNKTSLNDTSTSITCYQSARYDFESIHIVGIKGIAFLGCVNNEAKKIRAFTIDNCRFSGQGGSGKGLKLVRVSTVSIANSNFYFFNGALHMIKSKQSTTISNCNFQNNIAVGNQAGGGALYAYLSPNISIVNCTLNNNLVIGHEKGYGGAIAADSSPTMTIVNSTLNSNAVTGEQVGFGGAVYVNSPNITIINSILNNNVVTGDEMGAGGALFADSSENIIIVNSTLNNNTAIGDPEDGAGGALFVESSPNTILVDCIISNNTAIGGQNGQCHGGAVFADSSPIIKIVNSTLNNNNATGEQAGLGGAVYVNSSPSITIVNSKLKSNSVTVTTGQHGQRGAGGALHAVSSPNIAIVNTGFSNNIVSGGLDGLGGAVYAKSSPNITIMNSRLNKNTVIGDHPGSGGAVYIDSCTRHITIVNVTLNSNSVIGGRKGTGGAVSAMFSPNITIVNGTLNNNTVVVEQGQPIGRAVAGNSSRLYINSTFNSNNETGEKIGMGGAMYVNTCPNIAVVNSTLKSNSVITGPDSIGAAGALHAASSPNITIVNTEFSFNIIVTGGVVGPGSGGAMLADSCPNINIVNSTLMSNTVTATMGLGGGGGVIFMSNPNITIVNSKLNNNTVNGFRIGGAIYAQSSPNITITNTALNNNIVNGSSKDRSVTSPIISTVQSNTVNEDPGASGGALVASSSPNICIANSTLNNNLISGDQHTYGGAMVVSGSSITIVNSTLSENTVLGNSGRGGAVYALNIKSLLSTVSIISCVFIHNNANKGSVFYLIFTPFSSKGLLIMQNNITSQDAIYAIQSTLEFSDNTTANGTVVLYSCNATFTGYTNIENSNTSEEGGAIRAFQSTILLLDRVDLMYNRATRGGAIAVTESKLYVYGNITISHNTATESGGGIYAYQSELNFNKVINISNNFAEIGGGIYAISSTIRLTNGSKTYIVDNYAKKGGGMSLGGSAKIYLLKQKVECTDKFCISNSTKWISLHFINNTASYGGAIYVTDKTASTTCYATPFSSSSTINMHNECFIQELLPYNIMDSYQFLIHNKNTTSYMDTHFCNTYFTDNSAKIAGNALYGGLLDRCSISPIAETIQHYGLTSMSISSIAYILNITNLEKKDFDSNRTISSDPVRICFCKDNQPDCSYHPQPKYVRKEQTFTVSLVAVDHINNSLANSTTGVPKIQAYVSLEAKLGEGQSIQETNGDGSCTDLVYSILSPHNTEELHLYADGPCKDSGISIANLTVSIAPCPIGFKDNGLLCECDPIIYPEYISNCSIETETVQRKDNVWFSYLNDTTHKGYVLHKYCPFDYCHPPIENVSVNLNIENGADKLCMFNRSGKLCGSCEDGLSLSLGSSRCRPCSNNWLALFIAFALTGIALIVFILKVNFVVAEGTFNALILYANIFAANRAIFFPHDQTKILSVFIAWINLDFGFESCLFDGMDGYVKTWLQLAFPLYVISLVAAIFIISDHYTKFAMLFVGTNIIGTLATLILLSYTKLLRTIIAALQFTTLQYSDGSSELVWLVDANIPYLSPKHIPLFITALLILIVGTAFTLIVFAWQWLVYCPNRGPLRWIISNGKFIAFIDAFHHPYNKDHRYWIGLLFLVRVILYLVSAVNVLGDPRVNLLSIAIVITSILTFQIFIMPWKRTFIHKKNRNNVLDVISLLNLIALTVATLFINQAKNQSIAAYVSTGVAFATFLAILVHHVKTFVLNEIPQNIKLKFHKFLGVNREMYIDNHTLSPPCHPYKESIADHETEVNALPEPLDTIDTPEEDSHGESVVVLLTETESNSTNNGLKESTQPALPNKVQSSATVTISNTSDTLVDLESPSPTANQQTKTDQDMYSLKQDKPSQQKVFHNGPNEEQLYQDKDQHLLEKTASYSSLTETIPSSHTSQFIVSGTTPFEIELPTWTSEHQWSTSPSQEEGDQSDDDDEYSPLLP